MPRARIHHRLGEGRWRPSRVPTDGQGDNRRQTDHGARRMGPAPAAGAAVGRVVLLLQDRGRRAAAAHRRPLPRGARRAGAQCRRVAQRAAHAGAILACGERSSSWVCSTTSSPSASSSGADADRLGVGRDPQRHDAPLHRPGGARGDQRRKAHRVAAVRSSRRGARCRHDDRSGRVRRRRGAPSPKSPSSGRRCPTPSPRSGAGASAGCRRRSPRLGN